jgi:hypothetical protein
MNSVEQAPWEANNHSDSQQFNAVYGTQRFVTAFTTVHH